jgi:manganese efflux pump family protein
MFGLLSLGFTLSLDNFRSSLVLGGLKPTFRQSVKTSAIFGVWDGVAPLVGILMGEFLSTKIAGPAETIAMVGLAAYGLFLIVRAVISPERADPDLKWARFGLPIPLSIDNVVGGTALGLAGYSPWLAPVLFAVITFWVSLAGHQIGRTVASAVGFIPRINTDLLTGIGFAVMAALLALGVHLPLSDG